MNQHKSSLRSLMGLIRRGVALAALVIFATTAAASWLASEPAEARPTSGARVAQKSGKESSPPVRVAEADTDRKLVKNGKVLSGKLNINTATEEQLRMLPGIGPAKAQRILDYRARRGKFKRVRDLRRVKGFGYKTVNKLSPYLTVEGKTTLTAE